MGRDAAGCSRDDSIDDKPLFSCRASRRLLLGSFRKLQLDDVLMLVAMVCLAPVHTGTLRCEDESGKGERLADWHRSRTPS